MLKLFISFLEYLRSSSGSAFSAGFALVILSFVFEWFEIFELSAPWFLLKISTGFMFNIGILILSGGIVMRLISSAALKEAEVLLEFFGVSE